MCGQGLLRDEIAAAEQQDGRCFCGEHDDERRATYGWLVVAQAVSMLDVSEMPKKIPEWYPPGIACF